MSPEASEDRGRARRPPRKITADFLRRAALHHLDRYPTTRGNLRQVLLRRVRKSVRYHGGPEDADQLLEALLDQLVEARALDDARWARSRAEALHRRGSSERMIRQKLRMKLVPAADIDRALAGLKDDAADPELLSACAYVRRRRLGPMRAEPELRRERRQRDLAAMARAGFRFELARKVIDCDDEAALEELLAEAVSG